MARPLTALVEDDVREDNRYGLYVFDTCPECGGSETVLDSDGSGFIRCPTCKGEGVALQQIAMTSLDGIGTTLRSLEEDRRELEDEPGNPVIGILDRQERRWLSGVWQRGR